MSSVNEENRTSISARKSISGLFVDREAYI